MKGFDPTKPISLAFIPPPRQKIDSVKIWKQESISRAAIAELKGIANIIPNQKILINAIVLQEAKDSSAIENIITTQDDLYKAISVTSTKKYNPETKEVLRYREALYEGFNRINKRGMLTINDVIAIQNILVMNDAGVRKTPGIALVNEKTKEVIYTPPQDPDEINRLMRNFTEYLNNEENSLIKMAILHYQFESIHPFYDGNGRTGRIINVLYLILKGYLETPILYLSSYIIKNKDEYYRLLLGVTRDEKWEDWILYILRGVEEISKKTIERIKKIKYLLDSTIEKVKIELPRIYSKELVETLFVNPYCKTEFVVKGVGVERKAAARYLHKLAEKEILGLYKVGKENIFVNKGLMEILAEKI